MRTLLKLEQSHLTPNYSMWYNSPEQVKKRGERSQRLRELYATARKAREKVND